MITVKRTPPPPPAPPPPTPIETVTVSNYGNGRPWNLELRTWDQSTQPLVRITDDKDANYNAIYLRPDDAEELAEALTELANQARAAR